MIHSDEKTTSGKEGEQVEGQPRYPQSQSRFLELPVELRYQIYIYLFASTRLAFGKKHVKRMTNRNIKLAPNSLSILRTCRQINRETRSFWLSQVLFHFEDVKSLLDKLSKLDPTTIAQIRYIRTTGASLRWNLPGAETEYSREYPLIEALNLQPELRLERLIVLGSSPGVHDLHTLQQLIEHGSGWRELYFVTPDYRMLDLGVHPASHRNAQPQPSTWQETLARRDSTSSRPSVKIYCSTLSQVPGVALNPLTRRTFEQKLTPRGNREIFEIEDGRYLKAEEASERELLVM